MFTLLNVLASSLWKPLDMLFFLFEMPSAVITRHTSMKGIPTGKEKRLSHLIQGFKLSTFWHLFTHNVPEDIPGEGVLGEKKLSPVP